jgi:Domain of unknown function (DUF4214)
MKNLLELYDEQFVQACYTRFLEREADSEGAAYYLERLRKGENKYAILSDIAMSKEAVAKGTDKHTHVGYRIYRTLCAIPILGRFIEAAEFLWNCRKYKRDLRAAENYFHRVIQELNTRR